MLLAVLGSPISPFVRKVTVTLIEKGVAFEQEMINPFDPPDGFRDLSPLGKIPVLRDGDRLVNDSSVICRYLDRLHPDPSIYPSDAFDSARAEWIEEFIDGGLFPVAGPKVFFPLVLAPLLQGKEPDEERAARAVAEELPPFWDYLDHEIGDREFFVGDALSIADITVASALVNLRLAGVRPDPGRWPSLNGFLKRMHGRNSLRQTIEPVVEAVGKRWVELD